MGARVRSLAALAALTCVVAGCGAAPERQSTTGADYGTAIDLVDGYDPNATFTYGYVQFASSWDPILSITGADYTFYAPVYDRLLRQTPDGEIEPMLATDFTAAEDNLSMTLTLREGLTFSDGTAFDAEAVKFNLDRARGADSRISGELYQISSIEVVDPLTVKINVTGSLGSLAVALASRPGMMVSPTAAQAGELQTKPVGVGAYQATEIVPGDHAVYEKTANYWDPDAQRLGKIEYKLIQDDQTRLNALLADEVDGAYLAGDQFDTAADRELTIIERPAATFIYFAVNTSVAPFGDPEVHKALNMAIDREAIAQGLYDGYCTPQIQPFAPGSVGYSNKVGDGLAEFPYDPAAAKKILEDKGVTSVDIASVSPNVTIYTKFGEVVQEQLAEVGINIEVKSVPAQQVVQEFSIDKSSEATTSVFTGINDPDALSGRYLQKTALFNPGGADYPELVAAANEGAASTDPAQRKAGYEKFMDAWVAKPPHIVPVCMVHQGAGFHDRVSGVTQMSSGATDLRYAAVAAD